MLTVDQAQYCRLISHEGTPRHHLRCHTAHQEGRCVCTSCWSAVGCLRSERGTRLVVTGLAGHTRSEVLGTGLSGPGQSFWLGIASPTRPLDAVDIIYDAAQRLLWAAASALAAGGLHGCRTRLESPINMRLREGYARVGIEGRTYVDISDDATERIRWPWRLHLHRVGCSGAGDGLGVERR